MSDDTFPCRFCGGEHPITQTVCTGSERSAVNESLRVSLLEEALVDCINQACRLKSGTLDSMGLSAYADGMRLLARLGYIEIRSESGRRVIGEWTRE